MTTWHEATIITVGLVLDNRLAISAVNPEKCIKPYDDIIKLKKENPHIEIEEIIERVGLSPVQSALDAAHTLNGLGNANWVAILEQSALAYTASKKLQKIVNRMEVGEAVDRTEINYWLNQADAGLSDGFTRLPDIEKDEVPFIPVGWKPLDDHLVGVPKTGLVIIGGNPGSGKTWLMNKITAEFVKTHDKNVGVFSLEMTLTELLERYETYNLNTEDAQKLITYPHPVTIENIIAKAATIDNLGLVTIDYADLLVHGESSESAYSHIYRTCMLGAKELGCPIILLAQLSNYYGGLPRPNNLRYTRLAEALAWQILMTYNPTTDWFSEESAENTGLPIRANTGFVLAWKVRGGFRNHLLDSPGAIMIPFVPSKGWGDKSKWFSLKKEI